MEEWDANRIVEALLENEHLGALVEVAIEEQWTGAHLAALARDDARMKDYRIDTIPCN